MNTKLVAATRALWSMVKPLIPLLLWLVALRKTAKIQADDKLLEENEMAVRIEKDLIRMIEEDLSSERLPNVNSFKQKNTFCQWNQGYFHDNVYIPGNIRPPPVGFYVIGILNLNRFITHSIFHYSNRQLKIITQSMVSV